MYPRVALELVCFSPSAEANGWAPIAAGVGLLAFPYVQNDVNFGYKEATMGVLEKGEGLDLTKPIADPCRDVWQRFPACLYEC